MSSAFKTRKVRFAAFEVDLRSCELFKHGIRIKLQDQPFEILTMLLERPGELVPREELRRKLWASDTFVDFDAGLNAAIRRLRDALNDSADTPRYIETLPRHGYRFIASVEPFPDAKSELNATAEELPPIPINGAELTRDIAKVGRRRPQLTRMSALVVAGSLTLAVVLTMTVWRSRLFSTHASAGIRSIAVLPLQNLSGDPNQDYFADGMTDALITDLAQTRSLRVISKTSSDRYRKTQKKLSEIAKELNVDAVVEGAVLRSGDQVRIDAQLIRAEDDQHLWARSYDRKISDVLSLQADVAQAIASEIEVKLAPEQQSPRPPARPVNAQAYEAYLKGAYFYGGEEQDLEKAIKYFQKSADLDPTYVPAYLGLGESYGTMAYLEAGTIPPAEAWLKSEINIAKALELDPKSSLAHNQLGMNRLLHHCDRPGAEKELNLALELDPSDMHSLDYHSFYLLEVGRSDQAIAEKRRVLDHDPVSVITKSEFGMYLSTVGRLDEAIQQFQDTLELDPNSGMTRMRLGSAYADQHHYEQAVVQMKKALAIERRPRWLGRLGWVYARWGKASESLELIKELKELSKHGDVSPSLIARIYAVLGEKEQALIWLEKAKGDYPGTSDDGFDSLRSDPRFKVLEARLKPEESCLGF